MKSLPLLFLSLLLSILVPGFLPAQAIKEIGPGLWAGNLAIRKEAESSAGPRSGMMNSPSGASGAEGTSLQAAVTLRLLGPGQGALLDIPEQSMFGYPLDQVAWTGSRLSFSFGALGPLEDLAFEGIYSNSLNAIIGTARSKSWRGSFRLSPVQEKLYPGEQKLKVRAEEGELPGTLLIPDSAGAFPGIVVLLSGSGTSDRDGNNFSVPGHSDSLALLARALASRSIASFRYDKRGSGEAYMRAESGMSVSLDEHIDDAARIIADFIQSGDYARIIVAGMNEGAWVGAAALNRLEEEGLFADGLAAIAVSGERPLDLLRSSLEGLSPALQDEAAAITEAILSDRPFSEPSPQLADFFAPQRLSWLKSWLAFDPARELARVKAALLLIYGANDMQVSRPAFEKLLDARPQAAARIIPSMNYALKRVETETENFDSFTNPEYPVSEALSDLLAAFAQARPAPEGSFVYVRE
ncbi:MAG: alpha/beta fold hydrolase [Spirochaetia bacterium]|nr:alpha/beta fold hydrolase [Spirochaetia bacterium]